LRDRDVAAETGTFIYIVKISLKYQHNAIRNNCVDLPTGKSSMTVKIYLSSPQTVQHIGLLNKGSPSLFTLFPQKYLNS
jgi:hypothetical protein